MIVGVLAATLSAVLPAGSHVCSMVAFSATLPADLVYFLGHARSDTLAVAPAPPPVDPVGGPWAGRWEPTRFGQSARVRRVDGALTANRRAELATALISSDSVVVLVPWELSPGCTPLPWRRSVRWIEPGTAGLFRGRLRARHEWVRGVPTLDVYLPDVEPYPSGPSGAGSSFTPGPRLTAAELFSLFQALPIDSALRRQPEPSIEALRRWADANPVLASRQPAAGILRQARWAARYYRIRLTPLPLAGTYRFTVASAGGPSFSFYARTESAPSGTWDDARLASEPDSLPWRPGPVRQPEGFDADVVVAATERELPRDRIEAERRRQPRYSFRIAAAPSDVRRGVRFWRGAVDFAAEALPVLAKDSSSRARLAELAELARQLSSVADPRALPATFRQLPNGAVEVTQQLRLRDGRLLTLRGVRNSDVAVTVSD